MLWKALPNQWTLHLSLSGMIKDEQLRAQQHQNELRAFLRYEQRLKQAYARSQDPFPGRWQPDGHRRRVQVNG